VQPVPNEGGSAVLVDRGQHIAAEPSVRFVSVLLGANPVQALNVVCYDKLGTVLAVLEATDLLTTRAREKPMDAIAKEFQYEPLPTEVRIAVIAAWTRGGLLPQTAIEQMIPAPISRAVAVD
jgi:hypothetical protein